MIIEACWLIFFTKSFVFVMWLISTEDDSITDREKLLYLYALLATASGVVFCAIGWMI